MSEVISVSPFRCRMWRGHGRLDEHINEETCRAEIDSFLQYGQQLPALGRPLRGDKTHDFELLYGARRLFVARHLNLPLLLELRDLSDREAIVAIDIENRHRKELSPYERGRAYDFWIRNQLFASQQALARTLKISASQVSRLIRLAQLPEAIVSAFENPLDIREIWGRKLVNLWQDPERRQAMTRMARAISEKSQPHSADSAFKRLVAAASHARRHTPAGRPQEQEEVIRDDDGAPLFCVRQHHNDTAVLIPINQLSRTVLSEIKREVAAILQRGASHKLELDTRDCQDAVATALEANEALAQRRIPQQLEAR